MSASCPGSLRLLVVALLALFAFQTTSAGQYSPVAALSDGLSEVESDEVFARAAYAPSSSAPAEESPFHLNDVSLSATALPMVPTGPGHASPANAARGPGGGKSAVLAPAHGIPRGRAPYGLHIYRQVLSYLQSAAAIGPDYLYTARPVGGDFREGMAAAGAAKDGASDRSQEIPLIFSLRPNWEQRKPRSDDPTEDEEADRGVSTFYYLATGDASLSLAGNRSVSSDDMSDYVQDFDQDPIEYRSVNGWTESDGAPRTTNADGSPSADSSSRDGLSLAHWHSGLFWNSHAAETASGESTGPGGEAAPVGIFQRLLRWALRNPATAAFVAAVSAVFLAVVVAKNPAEAGGPR
jgi:hypothetical protein